MPQIDQIFSRTRAFQAPILARSLGQLATSLGGFSVTCAAMYLTLAVSLWIALALSTLAAGSLLAFLSILAGGIYGMKYLEEGTLGGALRAMLARG